MQKCGFTSQVLYPTSLGAIKLSVILFLLRTLPPVHFWRRMGRHRGICLHDRAVSAVSTDRVLLGQVSHGNLLRPAEFLLRRCGAEYDDRSLHPEHPVAIVPEAEYAEAEEI
jgi:hypothetical protein